MSLRNAFDQAGLVIPFAVMLALLWTILVAVEVAGTMQPYLTNVGVGMWVGQSWIAGVVGLCVLAVLGVALAYLSSEFGESEPTPQTFPPEE